MNADELCLPIQGELASTISARQQLLDSLRDKEYRHEFVSERVRASVALQIRALRQSRNNMTQKALGDAIGMAQTWVSKLENPDYGKMTVATLLRLAQAFDTDLEIKFRPFSTTIRDLPRQGQSYFAVPSFEDEYGTEDLSAEELERDISKAGLFTAATEMPGFGAAAAQMSSGTVMRMPPAMESSSATVRGRLYGNF